MFKKGQLDKTSVMWEYGGFEILEGKKTDALFPAVVREMDETFIYWTVTVLFLHYALMVLTVGQKLEIF